MDYVFNMNDMLSASEAESIPKTEHTSSSDLVSSSLYMAEGLDAPSISALSTGAWTDSSFSGTSVYSSPPLFFPTPESSPQSYSYYHSIPTSNPPVLAPPITPVTDLFRASYFDDSPISSPGDSLDSDHPPVTSTAIAPECKHIQKLSTSYTRSPSPLSTSRHGMMPQPNFAELGSAGEEECTYHGHFVPDGVKMPQRKGGMQLWQFLYSILTNSDGKYRNIIEWTHTAKEREFRLLEPDAIAIWWGHHKNKPNMSYDKLSRSLRYYYDKGIIRKISGERFVYRFCIDPELMYTHMGTSHSRPKLKPMPQDAKLVLTKEHSMSGGSPCIAQAPECLSMEPSKSPPNPPPPYPFASSCSPVIPTTSTTASSEISIRRCHSFDNSSFDTTVTSVHNPISCPSSFGGYPSHYCPLLSSNSPPPLPNSTGVEHKPLTPSLLATSTSCKYNELPCPILPSYFPLNSQNSTFVSPYF